MNHHRLGQFLGLALVLMMASQPGAAVKLYKWVDDQGNVTYSQLPPPEQGAESLELKGIEGVTNSQAQERLGGLRERAETVRKDREYKSNYTSENRNREERIKANCENARQNVRVLETGSRIKADDGSFLDDAQRVQRLQDAQQQVEEFCES